jgi:phospholipid N-methyltransferase
MKKSPKLEFFLQSLTHFREIGTFFPCSRITGRAMASIIDINKPSTIVELGVGTGPVTESILERMNGLQKYVGIEKNKRFYDFLRRKFQDPRVRIVHDTAENFPQYVEESPLYIISVLPLAIFKPELKERILETVAENLAPGGTFAQFQYLAKDYKFASSFFRDSRLTFMPWNIPPGFIYTCTN